MRLDPHFGMLPVGAFEHCGDRRIRLHGGGGGIPIVSDVFDVVEDVAGGAVDIVDNVVSEVGSGIDQVAQTIDKTVTAAMDDPVNTAIRATAFVVGGPAGLAAANAAIGLGQGQSLEDAATNAAISFAASQVGAEAGGYVPTEYAPYVQQATTGATNASLRGGDAGQGALSGIINSGLSGAAKSISDQAFEDWSREQAANTYENSYSPTEQDVLAADPSIEMNFPLSTPTTETGPGYYDEITGEFIPSEIGGLTSPLNDLSGTNIMPDTAMDDIVRLSNNQEGVSGSDLLAEEVGMAPESYDPLATTGQIKQGLGMLANSFMNQQQPMQARTGLSTIKPVQKPDTYGSPKLIGGSELAGDSTGDPYYLQNLRQIYGTLTPNIDNEMNQDVATFATGGSLLNSSTSTSTSKTADSPYDPFPTAVTGITRGPLIGGGQRRIVQQTPLQQLRTGLTSRMASGGMAEKYASATPRGHNPEFITGLTGYYASGKGTGQSDDIDAMLHDGDYVADADLVAALGDGSSKAGAEALEKFRRQVPHQERAEGGQPVPAKIADGEYVFPSSFVTAIGQGDNKAGAKILDKMREAIRAHKRSAPTTKIPPKAKSPLEYLKMVKG